MAVVRERQYFPTRNYPYRSAVAEADAAPQANLAANTMHAFVLGLDQMPRPMAAEEVGTMLRDPFAGLLLKSGTFPLTLRALLAALDAMNGEPGGLPEQHSFLVADGGQIPWSEATAQLARQFRFAVVRARAGQVQIMVSASSVPDSSSQFLQVIAWDPANLAYNFYERRGGTWIWAGNSHHALQPATRGQGPFDSHVNGSMVMKELRVPWNNWHSMAASITDATLAPDDPLRTEPIFVNRESAHFLEQDVVREGIARWNKARMAGAKSGDGTLRDVPFFLRQLLESTTVNLVSAAKQSALVRDEERLSLPTTFFLNSDAFIDEIGLEPGIAPVTVSGAFYRTSLTRYGFALTDGQGYRQPGDTYFAFLVPEPAFEDINVLSLLLRERIVSQRFVACLLMIDFQNPIFSPRRQALMNHVPAVCQLAPSTVGGPVSNLEALFVKSAEGAAAGDPADGAATAFLQNWRVPDDQWRSVFARRIEAYFAALAAQGATESGFDGWVRLAESRRREFSRRPLAEFRLTLPVTNIPLDAPVLEMREDGTVAELH
ncbi:hypothetical protein [Bradyrhizobium sp.]|jgi:hypothetical protein|uniref:hypothetical protein n=1 Tax=Bradyrhizobium sp. TaxID=376 RepID=UPI002E078F23|nr:hypothetical protein [Bradyrhizobium sp.]